jgi:3-oxoadipate enol-lactonase
MAYARTRLGRWFYEDRGKQKRAGDPAIVLLHGLLFDGGMWSRYVEPLSGIGRVLVFDGPGHGRSELPPPFSLEDHTDALLDALTTLDVSRAVFVGLSWGGMVAMRAAIHSPKRVAAMVLMDSSADAEDKAKVIKYRLLASFARRFGVPPFLAQGEMARHLFGAKTREEHPEILERWARTVNGYSRDGVARAAKAVVIHRKSIADKLESITAPTLVVCGRDDAATEPAKSEAIARAIPGARLEWIEGSGHMSAIEKPEAVGDVMLPFIRAHVSE